ELYVCVAECHTRKARIHHNSARLAQISLQANLSFCASVPAKVSEMQISDQKWIQIDVPDSRFASHRIWRRQTNRVAARDAPIRHRLIQFQFRLAPIRRNRSIETSNRFLSHSQVHNAERPFSLRSSHWT